MDIEWVAIALGDIAWIFLAFVLGFAARAVSLPPLVGFLATGFALNYFGFSGGDTLEKLADLGITLLLFTIGLKLKLNMLIRPQVWGVTSLHIGLVMALFGALIWLLMLVGLPLFTDLTMTSIFVLAFALSFSSTVFVAKALEEAGEMKSLHGRIAISILVMQDVAAVLFLAFSKGEVPSPYAVLLFLLIPMRPLFHLLLQKTGHGELLILYGLAIALGGAELFELAGVKDDLGALILGVLLANHPKSTELAKSMFGFKDLFLVGFFLSIGMVGQLTLEAVVIGVMLVPLVFAKSALFYALMTRFKLRARTSLLTTLNLSNYSEFGLIVCAIGVVNGWLASDWLVVIAIALSLSFILAGWLTEYDDHIYSKYRHIWLKYQSNERLPDDQVLDTQNAKIAIFGMGRVGTGTYDKLRNQHDGTIVGVDFDAERVNKHCEAGRNVMRGDPSDADFWEQVHRDHKIELVLLALPNLRANLDALEQLRVINYSGRIAATARFPDEEKPLRDMGVESVFNIYAEAGVGFAAHVESNKLV